MILVKDIVHCKLSNRHGVGADDDSLDTAVVVDVESTLSRPSSVRAWSQSGIAITTQIARHVCHEPEAMSTSLIARRMIGFQATR